MPSDDRASPESRSLPGLVAGRHAASPPSGEARRRPGSTSSRSGRAGAATGAPPTVYSSADHPPFYLYWSPDGRRLTFLTTEPDGLALRLAPADASGAATAIREGAPMYWAWADADRLLVHSGGDGRRAFFGEVGTDGVAVEPAAVEPGDFRAPGGHERRPLPGLRRAGRRDSGSRSWSRARDGPTRTPWTCSGRRHRLRPDGSELAFVAPDATGPRRSTCRSDRCG